MKKLGLVIFVIMQSACSSAPKYSERLSSWIGKSSEQLVSKWGIPSKTMDLDDLTIYEYNEDLGKVGAFISGTYVQRDRYCKTSFSIKEKTIVSFKWNGYCE